MDKCALRLYLKARFTSHKRLRRFFLQIIIGKENVLHHPRKVDLDYHSCMYLILVGPYAIMWVILQLPTVLAASIVWFFIFGWAVAAGYKDWLVDRRKREKQIEDYS